MAVFVAPDLRPRRRIFAGPFLVNTEVIMRSITFLYGFIFLWLVWAVPASQADSTGTIYGQVEIRSKDNRSLDDHSGVVIYLKEVNGNKGFGPSKGGHSMASENMKFAPEVLPVLVGTSVVFPNKDDTVHNAFSISEPKKFDLGRYGYGEENSVKFDKPGSVNVYCKIHPRMTGYILVLANPYFTLTDEKGNYSIKDVPIGTYTVVSWFPFGDSQEQKVDLARELRTKADFSVIKLRNSNPRKSLVDQK